MMAPAIRVSRLIKVSFALALAATVLSGLINVVGAVGRGETRADITDFHTFYIVGQLIWSGHFADAYHASAMLALEQAMGGRTVFMPWSYPPLFGVVAAALAALPLGIAFVLFAAGTLALYLWATAKLDAEGRWPIMLASTVSIVLNLRCGQNGLLSAGLVAMASVFLLRERPLRSGLFFATMAYKPHLIAVVPIVLVLQKRWLALAVAALGAVALTGASLVIFGPGVFTAFFKALPDVGRLMAAGAYPLHRMTSIFAFCAGLGMPAPVASLLHGAVAAGVLIVVGRIALKRRDPRLQLGLAIMAGFFISPYVYDYDLVLFGVGFILVAPALRQNISARGHQAILVGYALAQSFGLGMSSLVGDNPTIVLSPMGPALLAVFCCILRPLWTDPPTIANAIPMPEAHPEAKAA